MLRFISFGSGSSGNCYCLFTEADALMIDAGIGIRKLKKEFSDYGLSLSAVHNVIITHDHADHIKSIGSLSATYKLPVYTTASVHEGIFRNWYVKKKVDTAFIHYVEKNKEARIGSFVVTPFGVPHDSTDNVGYMINIDGKIFSIITDCGHITDDIKSVINQSDYLVIEANHDLDMLANGPYPPYLKRRISGDNGHLSNKSCGEVLSECASSRLQHVWLCHLSEKNNSQQVARQTVADILATRFHDSLPFQLDVLNRTTPTGVFDLEV